jgi:hypothetical protein
MPDFFFAVVFLAFLIGFVAIIYLWRRGAIDVDEVEVENAVSEGKSFFGRLWDKIRGR